MNPRKWPDCRIYVERAAAAGCTVTRAEHPDGEGRLLAVTIAAPSGHTVTELVRDMAEPLASTTVARLDRRLGLKTGLFR